MAAFAPMPRAKVMATVNHNARARAKERMATFRSRRKDMAALSRMRLYQGNLNGVNSLADFKLDVQGVIVEAGKFFPGGTKSPRLVIARGSGVRIPTAYRG